MSVFVCGDDPDRFPYHYIVFLRRGIFYAKACFLGGKDFFGADKAVVCQQCLNALGGNGIVFLKGVELPAGLTYAGNAEMWEVLDGVETKYTNGVPMSGTAYTKLVLDEFGESVTQLVLLVGTTEIVLGTV